jgi:phage antirepressor YoqD-like protein
MKNEIQIFNYNGSDITIKKENGIVYVNLTEIARAFPEKNLSQIVNSQEVRDYVQRLAEIQNYSSADLLRVTRGGNDKDQQGTWAHQKVALRVCQKLSTDFAILVDTKIEEFLIPGMMTLPNFNNPAEAARAWASEYEQKQIALQNVEVLEAEVKELAPKAEYTDKVLQSTSTLTMTEVAKELGMSQATLGKKLLAKKIIFKQSGNWFLTAKYHGRGYTGTRTHHFTNYDGSVGTKTRTAWTESGRRFVHQIIESDTTEWPEFFD